MSDLLADAPEQWRPIEAWPKYEISDLGRVRRLYKTRGPRVIKAWPNPSHGYWNLSLRDNGRRRTAKVHVLVASAFLGPRPEGMVTRHLNDDKSDNRLVNLAYGTPSENQLDAVTNGVHSSAKKTHCPQGHPYSAGNTSKAFGGRRRCKTCHARNQRNYLARKAA